ncbi:hypothetical protein [Henriciella marina]|uniref:hypothetical protein n=1 Tax=Henriciella marina TaxID=453851 RepID=UPI000364AA34|nr:hypothetical protein [Henriciella marina]
MLTARRLLLMRNEATEAVQESWAAICRGWFGLRDPSRFPAWCCEIKLLELQLSKLDAN